MLQQKILISRTGIEPVTDGYLIDFTLQSTALPTELSRVADDGIKLIVFEVKSACRKRK